MIDIRPDIEAAIAPLFKELKALREEVKELRGQRTDDAEFIPTSNDLAKRWKRSISTIHRITARPGFPKRGPLGWKVSEIEAWEEKNKK